MRDEVEGTAHIMTDHVSRHYIQRYLEESPQTAPSAEFDFRWNRRGLTPLTPLDRQGLLTYNLCAVYEPQLDSPLRASVERPPKGGFFMSGGLSRTRRLAR
jgi:hypothetical protein